MAQPEASNSSGIQHIEPCIRDIFDLPLKPVIVGRIDIHRMDDSNAKLFKEMVGDEYFRYCLEDQCWYVWNGIIWERLKDDAIIRYYAQHISEAWRSYAQALDRPEREKCTTWANRSGSDSGHNALVRTLQKDLSLRVTPEELDSHNHLIAALNGYVDLDTGELLCPDKSKLITMMVTVEYDPDAESEDLDRYENTFIRNKEDIEILYAVLGQKIRGGNVAKMATFVKGPTNSGKSQITDALEKLLGPYAHPANVSILRGNLDDKPRPDLDSVMRVRVAIATEASEYWAIHADVLKKVTGGDSLPYRTLFKSVIRAKPKFTPITFTNRLPEIKGADWAVRERLFIYELIHPVEKPNTSIRAAFVTDTVLKALFARIVKYSNDVRFREGIRWDLLPERYAMARDRAYADFSDVGRFIDSSIDDGMLERVPGLSKNRSVSAAQLHKQYCAWRLRQNDRSVCPKPGDFKEKIVEILKWEKGQVNGRDVWPGWHWKGPHLP